MQIIHLYLVIICFIVATVKTQTTSCTTPNGESGTCIPLIRCVVLIQAAARNETKFLNESVCDEKTSKYCCGTTGKFTTPKPLTLQERFNSWSKEEKKNYALKSILPSKQACGLQHTDDYLYDGIETSIDEFPWIVYISERNGEDDENNPLSKDINCVGALISNRYVLSSNVSLNYKRFYDGTDNVDMLLGLHHVYKKGSCIPTEEVDCYDPLHVASSNWKIYKELVLFRLNEQIFYSDTVRPICLPDTSKEIPSPGSIALASGWDEEEIVKGKRLKKRLKYTVMASQDCPEDTKICGIPFTNNTHNICNGDLGGPLMYKKRKWFTVGVIAQNDLCNEGQPVTAIKLTTEIVEWIISNVEP